MTLAILDDLTPGDLTGGTHVAVTGTIDAAGNVGEIGGIEQKAVAARAAGVSLFIVPQCSPNDPPGYLAWCKADLARAAKRAGSKIKVVPVATFARSAEVLRDAGGAPVERPTRRRRRPPDRAPDPTSRRPRRGAIFSRRAD